MDPMTEAIEFDGTATVTAVEKSATRLVPVDTVAGGAGFWLRADQMPVCGELLGLVLRGDISRDSGSDTGNTWVDLQVVGQAREVQLKYEAGHWEAETSGGDKIAIAIPEGLNQADAQLAQGAEFWLFEDSISGVEIPGHFADLNGYLADQERP